MILRRVEGVRAMCKMRLLLLRLLELLLLLILRLHSGMLLVR